MASNAVPQVAALASVRHGGSLPILNRRSIRAGLKVFADDHVENPRRLRPFGWIDKMNTRRMDPMSHVRRFGQRAWAAQRGLRGRRPLGGRRPAGRGRLWAGRRHRPVRAHLAHGLRPRSGGDHRVPGRADRLTCLQPRRPHLGELLAAGSGRPVEDPLPDDWRSSPRHLNALIWPLVGSPTMSQF